MQTAGPQAAEVSAQDNAPQAAAAGQTIPGGAANPAAQGGMANPAMSRQGTPWVMSLVVAEAKRAALLSR